LATPPDDPELSGSRRGWFERLLDRQGIPAERALEVALQASSELPAEPSMWERAEQLARGLHTPERVAQAYRRALGVAAVRSPPSARPTPETGEPDESGPPLAGLEGDAIEEVGRRAVDYHEEWFDEPGTVIALLHRVLELYPGSTWAFERLKLIFNLGER